MKIKNTKLRLSDNFKNWIKEPKKLPKPPKYERHILLEPMYDAEIQKEWNIEPYSVPELFALLKHLIGKQPKGRDGELLLNWLVNIFYVKLEDRVVAVGVGWRSGSREWGLGASDLGGGGWGDGNCVFSRSLTSQNLRVLDLDGKIIEIDKIRYKLTKQ